MEGSFCKSLHVNLSRDVKNRLFFFFFSFFPSLLLGDGGQCPSRMAWRALSALELLLVALCQFFFFSLRDATWYRVVALEYLTVLKRYLKCEKPLKYCWWIIEMDGCEEVLIL